MIRKVIDFIIGKQFSHFKCPDCGKISEYEPYFRGQCDLDGDDVYITECDHCDFIHDSHTDGSLELMEKR